VTCSSRSALRSAATTVSEPAVGPERNDGVVRLRPDTIAPTTGTTAIPSAFFARRFSANCVRTSSRDRLQSWSTGSATSSSYPMRVISPASRSWFAFVRPASSTSTTPPPPSPVASPSGAAPPSSGTTADSQDRSAEVR